MLKPGGSRIHPSRGSERSQQEVLVITI
jgi:hypothetical protein